MTQSRSALAEAIEALALNEHVALTETRDGIVLHQLQGVSARRISTLLAEDGWAEIAAYDEGGDVQINEIENDDVGITLSARKPGVPDDVEAILTSIGLTAALNRPDLRGRVWVHALNCSFETDTVRFCQWGDTTAFLPDDPSANPRKFVRVLDGGDRFPNDLGRWLLRDPKCEISGRGIGPWRRMAVERLGQAIANEVEPDGNLLFRGPPVTRFSPVAGAFIEQGPLQALQEAARWVFENPREIENRHTILSAEVARISLKGGTVTDLASLSRASLDSAKIAYGFGVTQQSRDTLKALVDLRKAVTDETSKLSESTRSLATAVAGAVFANLGIIVARLTIPATSKWVPAAAMTLGVVLAVYVGLIIWSGLHYLGLQATLRNEWRERLYRFLDDSEYQRMVIDPVERAERGFKIACCIAGFLTIMLFVAVWMIAGEA